MRNAKIVSTIGPASEAPETLAALAEAGMSIARLNGSHGTPEQRRRQIDHLREVDAESDHSIGVLHDLPGPKVRTAPMDEPIDLEAGETIQYITEAETADGTVGVSHDITAVEPGDRVLLDDGRITTTVDAVEGDVITATVQNSAPLSGRKGVIVPGVELGLPAVTERDRREIEVAAEKGVDLMAASFVRDGESIRKVKAALAEEGADIPIIAKIERRVAVQNIEDIMSEAYGVMVARGDLGVEIPLEEVPIVQKRLIRTCNNAGVPVITATEMLESMIKSPRPTRAEASDVANAVLDGTDAVMLSGETAVGDHPVRVVETMARVVERVEESDEYDRNKRLPDADDSRTDAVARSARFLADDLSPSAIVVATESGYTARRAAKFRPNVPVVATTPNEGVRRRLALSWSVVSEPAPYTEGGASEVLEAAVDSALETDIVDEGDTVVVLSGSMSELGRVDSTNLLKVHVAGE